MSMTKQEIFTRVAVHLLRQRVPSKAEGGGACAYRGENGLKCAIGALIPDELCTPFFLEHFNSAGVQNTSVSSVLVQAGVLDCVLYDENIRLLVSLQQIHDSCNEAFIGSWQEQLQSYADTHNLQMPNLDDIDNLQRTETTETAVPTMKEYDHV